MIGSHYPVPEIEIQAVIAFTLLVVHIVVRWGIHPFEQPVPGKSTGRKFISGVPQYIKNGTPDREYDQGRKMNRHQQRDQGDDTKFYY
jgi:hypothetical protein